MADACIFCKIVAGQIPAFKLLETELIMAFLDINPLSKGHCLIIPKRHCQVLTDCTDTELQEMLPAAKRIATALGGQFNILQNNGPMAHQDIPHVHLHVIPKPNIEEGLKMKWSPLKVNMEALKQLCDDLRRLL